MTEMITGRDLVKRYGDFTAVDGISFAVDQGECFGFLGPNGAGKTTTIRMIGCVSPVSGGSLTVAGLDVRREPRRIKALLGVVPQEDNLDPDLSVRQNLHVYARYFDLPRRVSEARIEEAVAFLQLEEKQDQRIDQLSSGLKRRLSIARALINAPTILVLDEPTTGLDPQARHLVWQKLRFLQAQGVTLLLTSHNMEEAAHLCDRIVIMHLGRIIAQGTPAELVERYAGREVVELHIGGQERQAVLARMAALPEVTVEAVEDILYIYSPKPNGVDIESLRLAGEKVVLRRANLEDVFLRLTGRGLSE